MPSYDAAPTDVATQRLAELEVEHAALVAEVRRREADRWGSFLCPPEQ